MSKEPWKQKNPRPKAARKKLAPEQIAMARERAEAAGRTYTNLIDNMWAAKQAKK